MYRWIKLVLPTVLSPTNMILNYFEVLIEVLLLNTLLLVLPKDIFERWLESSNAELSNDMSSV